MLLSQPGRAGQAYGGRQMHGVRSSIFWRAHTRAAGQQRAASASARGPGEDSPQFTFWHDEKRFKGTGMSSRGQHSTAQLGACRGQLAAGDQSNCGPTTSPMPAPDHPTCWGAVTAGETSLVQKALQAAGGLRTGGNVKTAPTPGLMGWQVRGSRRRRLWSAACRRDRRRGGRVL
jgi:hypothetical protein